MRKIQKPTQQIWSVFLQTAESRSQFFGKYGERFDRRLYAEIESIIRLSHRLHSKELIDADTDNYKLLIGIQRDLLYRGQELYEEFP